MDPGPGWLRDVVAVILAVGLALSLVIIVAAVFYDAVRSDTPGLSENSTQILTGWGGGVIGILGSYLGFRAGQRVSPMESEQSPETTGQGTVSQSDRL